VVGVVVDNTVLSNFALVGRDDVLRNTFGDAICATDEVMLELAAGVAKELVPRLDWSWLPVLRMESTEERNTFEVMCERLGRGEASCLSLAISRNFRALTDDRDARMIAHRRNIAVSGTMGALVFAVKRGVLTLEGANALLALMIEKGYYAPFQKLDDLIGY